MVLLWVTNEQDKKIRNTFPVSEECTMTQIIDNNQLKTMKKISESQQQNLRMNVFVCEYSQCKYTEWTA
jgi:hypothetical protein